MLSRRIGVATAMLVVPVALAGCGSSKQSGTSADGYTALTKATFAKAISDAAAKATSVHMAATTSSGALTETADYNFAGAGAAQVTLKGTVGANTSLIVLRVIGSDAYAQIPSGKDAGKWAKVPPSVVNGNAQGLSPQGLAAVYEKDAQEIRYVGTTTLNGQAVRQYQVVLPASSLSATGASFGSSGQDLSTLKTVTEQIYLSDSNLIQRIVVESSSSGGSMTVDFTKWNQVEPITAPLAADIATTGK